MKVKPVIPRDLASRDTDEAVSHYLSEGSKRAALAFVAALERAFEQIARHPASGSPRFAHELQIPGLRCLSLARFPHLIFYVEREDHIDVWRVLHGKRDIPGWLQDPRER